MRKNLNGWQGVKQEYSTAYSVTFILFSLIIEKMPFV